MSQINAAGIIALHGWHDAGAAGALACAAVAEQCAGGKTRKLSSDRHYVLTTTRPQRTVGADRTSLHMAYPQVALSSYVFQRSGLHVSLVTGDEPDTHWPDLAQTCTDALKGNDIVFIVESVPANVAHTLPLNVRCFAPDPQRLRLIELHHVSSATALGELGFTDILAAELARLHVPVMTLSVDVPMYAAGGHNPKAALALVHTLDSVVQAGFDTRELSDEAHAWESGVNVLVNSEPDLKAWVERLDRRTDLTELPQARGENIAAEFERFLRSRRA